MNATCTNLPGYFLLPFDHISYLMHKAYRLSPILCMGEELHVLYANHVYVIRYLHTNCILSSISDQMHSVFLDQLLGLAVTIYRAGMGLTKRDPIQRNWKTCWKITKMAFTRNTLFCNKQSRQSL